MLQTSTDNGRTWQDLSKAGHGLIPMKIYRLDVFTRLLSQGYTIEYCGVDYRIAPKELDNEPRANQPTNHSRSGLS